MSPEKELINEIMRNYSMTGLNGRPVHNLSQPVVVEFGLGLIQIDLNEKSKVLATSMWSRYVSVLFVAYIIRRSHDDYIIII